MRLDVSLAGLKHPMHAYTGGRECMQVKPAAAELFIKRYDTAKILIIIDTHCGDNGRFMYAGDDEKKTEYKACSLPEVITTDICSEIL